MFDTTILGKLFEGDKRSLARCITIVENELPGHKEILSSLHFEKKVPVIGITGPPGAGKSTLINSLVKFLLAENKKIGIIAIDPTSPFNYGSLLGDRVRMGEHFNNENVFIRSLATRGSLGGLSGKTIEITDIMRHSDFDVIIVETVGVGQSEVEIVGLADTTVLVLVPEAGDEVQNLKSGVMEIADIFVVNKSDRPGADIFLKNLKTLLHTHKAKEWNPVVVKCTATKDEGINELTKTIHQHQESGVISKRLYLLTEKAYKLIQNERMKNIDKKAIQSALEDALNKPSFNLYKFIGKFV